jgi:hypothetical protein
MTLAINRFKAVMLQKRTGFLFKIKEQLLTYSKRKRALLLIILLMVPFGLLWVFLIMKADKKILN